MSDVFDSPEAVEEFKALMRDPAARQAFVELKATKHREGTRMRYEHVLRAIFSTPWAIREDMLPLIVDLMVFRAEGGRFSPEEIASRIGTRRQEREPSGGVAVVPVHGVIVPKASMFADISGGVSVDRIRQQFRQAMGSPEVGALVMDFDSPGGMVDQVPELAAEIRAARGLKPIVAVANTEMASGAYWLASQADEIVVSKSARIGSIGVFAAHEDRSKREEERGIKTTLVSAGRFKTEGNPFEPLSDEGRAHIQSLVDDYYQMFVADVAAGRQVEVPDVVDGFGEGRVVSASDALKLGMADRAGSLEGTVARLLKPLHDQRAAALSGSLARVAGSAFNATDTFTAGTSDTTITTVVAVVDNSEWDGNAAMTACDDAACYRAICAGRREGDPNERGTWALPHHKTPGSGPNAAGVRNALARLPQTQGLVNREAAQRHLEAHMREVNPQATSPEQLEEESLRATLAALSE